jgi:hypothetical protein
MSHMSRARRLIPASAALTAVMLLSPAYLAASRAVADDGGCSATGSIAGCLGEKNGTIDVTGEQRRRGRNGTTGIASRKSSQASAEAIATAAYCRDAAANATAAPTAAAFTEIVPLCHGLAPLPAAPPTRDQVITAFRQLTLYRGVIQTDPRVATLVNLETYFWCGDGARTCDLIGEGERTVTLLGQPVRIRPRILSYGWDFGDGATQEITAGKATHTYAHATTAAVTLTLTWTADYAVGTGAFQDIGDTTTTTSPTRALPVREAESVIITGG